MSVFNNRPLTPDICYFDVIERLLSEKEFWGHEALSGLLKAGLVPSKLSSYYCLVVSILVVVVHIVLKC